MQVDERSLRRLIKKLTLLLSATDAESVSSSRLSFKADLESYRLQLLRLSSIAHSTSASEIRSYTRELAEITEEQSSTQSRIDALKRKLEDVRRERKNKLEYDLVAGEIVKLPTREELEESLGRLQEGLEGVRREREKYRALSKDAGERMSGVVREVGRLREDVGFEVGERERREVERADGDGEVEGANDGPVVAGGGDDASEAGEKRSRKPSGDEVEEGEEEEGAALSRSGSSTPRRIVSTDEEVTAGAKLDPAAPTFRPSAAAGGMRRKRDSTAVTASDEEGEVGDGSSSTAAASNSNTPRKRQRTEEGEVGGAGESEEEEGSIRPTAALPERTGSRTRAGNKRGR